MYTDFEEVMKNGMETCLAEYEICVHLRNLWLKYNESPDGFRIRV
jgi:hypothetical protein